MIKQKTMGLKLLKDSRDLSYRQYYGQAAVLPLEYNVDTATVDTIQPIGNVMCTAITTCDIACDQMKVCYDYTDLFNRIPSTNEGAEPRKVLGEAVKNGLKQNDTGVIDKKWKSYFRADKGEYDTFDNIRSAVYCAESPVALCTPWYWEWMNESKLTEGKNTSNYHMYSCEGWTVINDEPYLIIEAWIGRKQYMSRAVCNKAMSTWGAQAWVLATEEVANRHDKNIFQKIIDLLTNFIISFKQQMNIPKESLSPSVITVEEVKPKRDLLNEFCLAIRDFEGKPGDLNYRNNNPGNIRGLDGKFMKFNTMEEGFSYLKEYVKRAARGAHKAYKLGCTIKDFFHVYAPTGDNNHPDIYAEWVAKRIGKDVNFKIIQLL